MHTIVVTLGSESRTVHDTDIALARSEAERISYALENENPRAGRAAIIESNDDAELGARAAVLVPPVEIAAIATKCAVCGRALTDAVSQELGIGPTCRKRWGFTDDDAKETSWAHVFAALGNAPDAVYNVVHRVR